MGSSQSRPPAPPKSSITVPDRGAGGGAPPPAAPPSAPPAAPPSNPLLDLSAASQQEFDALGADEQQSMSAAVTDPHSFIGLNALTLQDVMNFPADLRMPLVGVSNAFARAAQSLWIAPARSAEQAATLAEQFFQRSLISCYGSVGASNQVPINATASYKGGFVNALMLGLMVPDLPAGATASAAPQLSRDDRNLLRDSVVAAYVKAATNFGTSLSEEATLAGRG